MLGVCLGHQAIGQAFGGNVVRAPVPVHGKLSEITHQGQGVFRGINGPFKATRYHSLVVERATLPGELSVTAETDDGLIMGARTQDAAGARRAVSSREHRLGTRPPDPEEFSRPRGGLECTAARGRREARIEDAMSDDFKALIAQGRDRRDADARRSRGRLRPHDVGRGDAVADGRLPDGAARARRDRRRDHRRGHDDARQDAAGRGAGRCDRRRRHRRRCIRLLQHLDLRRASSSPAPACRSPSTATARCRRRSGAADVLGALGVKIDLRPGRGRALHLRGRHRLHVRAGASSRDEACRPDARRARHAHDLQSARAALQSGRREAADGRRVFARNGSSRWRRC